MTIIVPILYVVLGISFLYSIRNSLLKTTGKDEGFMDVASTGFFFFCIFIIWPIWAIFYGLGLIIRNK